MTKIQNRCAKQRVNEGEKKKMRRKEEERREVGERERKEKKERENIFLMDEEREI